jgi:hypothetical protein
MPQLLYSQGKSPWYPLDRRLGGTQSWSRCGGEETLLGLKPPIIQATVKTMKGLNRLNNKQPQIVIGQNTANGYKL